MINQEINNSNNLQQRDQSTVGLQPESLDRQVSNSVKQGRGKKIIILILIIFVLLCFSLIAISNQSVTRLSHCLEDLNKTLDKNIETATLEKWDREQVCINGNTALLNLSACYIETEKETRIPIEILEVAVNLLGVDSQTMDDYMDMHNEACVDYPEHLVEKQ